jgi:penicillin-binding protein 1C
MLTKLPTKLRIIAKCRRVVPGLGALATLTALAIWIRVGPLPAGLLDEPANPSTVILDRNGARLYEALSSNETRSVELTPEKLPDPLVSATVTAEDRRFWWHSGVDPVAILRALVVDLRARRIVEGGSTISQQVAKLLLNRKEPERERGIVAKIHEAIVALRLEHRYSKREMLAMYLNLAPYGNQYVGAERASLGYFGVPTSSLTPAQAAFLAALPQRPSRFNPYRNPESATQRQRAILHRMKTDGILTAEQASEALQERITFAKHDTSFAARHFVEMVLDTVPPPRPTRIETTLNSQLQSEVDGIVRSNRDMLREHGADNVAVVVLDNANGEWLAWEGSGDYFDSSSGAINGPLTPRQPGSALKPFTYALAFEQGFSPRSVLADIPSGFPTAEPGIVYSPRNYDGRYRGPLLARRALAGSENVPAVALAYEIGVPPLLRFLARAGITTLGKTAAYYGLGVTLGNAEVRLDELVAAYAAFARGGEWIEPTALRRTAVTVPRTHYLVSPRTAFWITDILADPEAREFTFGRGGNLELPFPVAVKTGTSQAYHDNWTIGYSRRVTVGVWVGNFDRTPLRNSSGVTGAAPIFHAVMLAAERRLGGSSVLLSSDPILLAPQNLVQREICALSGMAANAWCPIRKKEWVAADANLLPCSWHHMTDDGLLTFWPAEYRQWAHANGLDSGDRANTYGSVVQRSKTSGQHTATHQHAALAISSPPADATYLIDPTLRREFQTLPLRAIAPEGELIEWSVGGESLGSANANATVDWVLRPGHHQIVARDQQGRSATTNITVR